MSLTKRNLERLIEEDKICPYCFEPINRGKFNEHNIDECGQLKAREEDPLFDYTHR